MDNTTVLVYPSFLRRYIEDDLRVVEITACTSNESITKRDTSAGEFEHLAWHNCQVRMSVGRRDAVELYYQDCARLREKLGDTYTPTATDRDTTVSDNIYPLLYKWY